ncbi:MAG: hypothetical protein NTV70_16025 [Acidobacteria bacterium]|nr:hypothetical protein [Acidobacteriota bacterium]
MHPRTLAMILRAFTLVLFAVATWGQVTAPANGFPVLVASPPTGETPLVRVIGSPGSGAKPADLAASLRPVTPGAGLTILVLSDTLTPESFEAFRKSLLNLQAALPRGMEITLAVLGGQDIRKAGPYKTRAQLQPALAEMATLVPDQALTINPVRLYTVAAKSAAQLAGDWHHVLVAGSLPEVPPEVRQYLVAYCVQAFATARVRVGWWPLAAESVDWLETVRLATAGHNMLDDGKDFLAALKTEAPKPPTRKPADAVETIAAAELTWAPPAAPKAGFFLYQTTITLGPEISLILPLIVTSPGAEMPEPEMVVRLEKAIADARPITGEAKPASERFEQAAQNIELALSINPGDPRALRLGADLYGRAGRFNQAAPLLIALTGLDPDNGPLFNELGETQYSRQQFDAAETALRRARELKLKTARNAEQLARIRLMKKDDTGAVPLLAESLEGEPKNQPLWLERADAAERIKDLDQKALALERAFALGGLFVERRLGLTEQYLQGKQPEKALVHVDRLSSELPKEAAIREQLATFYERLDRPARALDLWQRTLEADPARELAHFRVARLHLDGKKHQEGLAAAVAGLKMAAGSARLHLARNDALEGLGQLYTARHRLNEAAASSKDTVLLARAAERADAYSQQASSAYRRLAEQLHQTGPSSPEYKAALRRGLIVALRDNDPAADYFRTSLSAAGDAQFAAGFSPAKETPERREAGGIRVLGGAAALAEIAHASISLQPDDFMEGYARSTANILSASDKKVVELFTEEIHAHFERVLALSGMGQKGPNGTVITLKVDGKESRKATERVLSLLGWKMKSGKQGVLLEAAEKGEKAKRHATTAALALDEVGMKEALEKGKPFQIEVPREWVRAFPDEAQWKAALYAKENPPGGLAEVLSTDARAAKVFAGLNGMEEDAVRELLKAVPLKVLVEKYPDLTFAFAPALGVHQGQAVVPGGKSAIAIWTKLAGTSPANASQFFRALFDKDDGRVLSYFAALSQLDRAHQEFFTKTPQRVSRFYDLFSNMPELRARVGRLSADSPFLDFMRNVPLNSDGKVDFPGSPEVWMVAKGQSSAAKLTKKLNRTAAPDVEDEILIRLSGTKYKTGAARRSELDNFIAVSNIDRFRQEPMDESTALLLAQQFADFEAIFPHFSMLTALNQGDYQAVFTAAAALKGKDRLDQNRLLSIFAPMLEMLARMESNGSLPPAEAAKLLRGMCNAFAQNLLPGQWSSAALDAVRAALARPGARAANPDEGLRNLLLESHRPVTLEAAGHQISRDAGAAQRTAYQKVLELQHVPTLQSLLAIDQAARDIGAGKGDAAPHLKVIEAALTQLPVVEVPKTLQVSGKVKENLLSYRPKRVQELAAELRQRTARKKANLKDIQKTAAELLDEIAPLTGTALTGRVYALYLGPDDMAISEDPLLVRKHEYVSLASTLGVQTLLDKSEFQIDSSKAGSYFKGSFGTFAQAVGVAIAGAAKAGGDGDAMVAAQLASLRATQWSWLRDEELRLAGQQIRLAREWIVQAATDPRRLDEIETDTLGLLSLTRRADLIKAIEARDWPRAWRSITLSELFHLAPRLAARHSGLPWSSPLAVSWKQAQQSARPERMKWLGLIAPALCDCSQPVLSPAAPYEALARQLMTQPVAQRSAEFKLYLAYAADSLGLPAPALAEVAEPLARLSFQKMKFADPRDWASALAGYAALTETEIWEELEHRKP